MFPGRMFPGRVSAGTAAAAAKLRAARRVGQGGAAMFVVAMTVAVLASVGMYALAAAGNEVTTSGNERQNTQTHYLAEYGVLAVTHEVSASRAALYLGIMLNSTDRDVLCDSLPNLPATASAQTAACHKMSSAELANNNAATPWAVSPVDSYGGSAPFVTGLNPGSFGAVPMNGDFSVELTDPIHTQAPPRYSQDNSFCILQFTATVTGFTQPLFPLRTSTLQTSFEGEGSEIQRVRFLAGPVTCPR
jgi:hypothetical protein